MLLKVSVKNFYSFREEVVFDFSEDGTPKTAASVAVVTGNNGAGKTNLLRAIQYATAYTNWGTSLIAKQVSLDVDSHFYSDEPSEISFEFLQKENHYKYKICILNQKIDSEELYVNKDGIFSNVFKRCENNVLKTSYYKHLESLVLDDVLSVICIKDMHKNLESIEHIDNAYTFFNDILTNVGPAGYVDLTSDRMINTATEQYKSDENSLSIVNMLIQFIDESIEQVVIEEAKDNQGKSIHFPLFRHTSQDGSDFYLPLHKESSGTKKAYVLFGLVTGSLKGGLLVIDELDAHFHISSTNAIVGLFLSEKTQGQLLFSAHSKEAIETVKDKKFIFNLEKVNNATTMSKR